MKATYKDALDIYEGITGYTKKRENIAAATKAFLETYGIKNDHVIRLKFTRMLDSKPKNNRNNSLENWKSLVFHECILTGHPVKRLSDGPCPKKQRQILGKMLEDIESFAEDEGITRDDALSLIVNECQRKWKSGIELNSKPSIPDSECLSIMFNVGLSISKYQLLRSICLPFVKLATRNTIDKLKKDLHPLILSQEIKASVNLGELQKQTAEAICTNKVISSSTLTVVGKFGLDGSGAHKIQHQIINSEKVSVETPHLDPDNAKSSILLVCWCPVRVVQDEKEIWSNPVANSTAFARPVALRGKEEREVLQAEVPNWTPFLKDYGSTLKVNGVSVDVIYSTKWSMIDGKMTALLQGDSGAFCHLCNTTREDTNKIVEIAKCYNIEKDYDTCLGTWQQIESGEIPYANTALRQGQCHKPISQMPLLFFAILHFKLRSLDFCLKILYHLNAGIKNWSEDSGNMRFLKAAKEECIEQLQRTTGLVFDKPKDGGNTNCGPIATQFFSPTLRNKICSLINNLEDRDNFSHLLKLLNSYITIVEKYDNDLRNIEMVKTVGINIMLHIRQGNERGLPWIYIIPTVHQVCAHAWELFKINMGKAISVWSESPVESWNKYVRAYQSGVSARARQSSIKEYLRDVLSRMLIESHPKIALLKPRPSCNICGEIGHTVRSSLHSDPKAQHVEIDSDAELIDSMLLK